MLAPDHSFPFHRATQRLSQDSPTKLELTFKKGNSAQEIQRIGDEEYEVEMVYSDHLQHLQKQGYNKFWSNASTDLMSC
jgi:hypothetical protein